MCEPAELLAPYRSSPLYRPLAVHADPHPDPARRIDVRTGKVNLAVHALGGTGPPVVLVHPAGFHGRVWKPVADALAAEFTCVAPDLRGHGDSPLPEDDDLHWRGFAADLLALVDDLGLRPPFGVGHSSGATALLLAEETRPGTFRALYCYEPVLIPAEPPLGPDPDNWLGERARARRATFTSRAEALTHYAAKPPLSALDPEVLRLYVDHGLQDAGDGTVRLKCRPDDEGRMYEMATAHDAYGRLGRVGCPVTVACGEESEAACTRLLGHLGERLPNIRTETYPRLGHLGPLEDPACVARSIRAAFADHLTPQPD